MPLLVSMHATHGSCYMDVNVMIVISCCTLLFVWNNDSLINTFIIWNNDSLINTFIIWNNDSLMNTFIIWNNVSSYMHAVSIAI